MSGGGSRWEPRNASGSTRLAVLEYARGLCYNSTYKLLEGGPAWDDMPLRKSHLGANGEAGEAGVYEPRLVRGPGPA